ncbi:MAG: hypothetical protein Q9184_008320, partial [Pyrenodesmia sp. 2 TL-2023]
ILNHMIGGHAFTGSTWRMSLRGREVGTVVFVVGTETGREEMKIGSAALSAAPHLALEPIEDPLTTTTAAAGFSHNHLPITFRFQFWGTVVTMNNVFMGAIAALIALASAPEGTAWDVFRASFPGYGAFWSWHKVRQGEWRMDKEVLVMCVVRSVRHALGKGDWRALRVGVVERGEGERIVAWGGYADFVEGTAGRIGVGAE